MTELEELRQLVRDYIAWTDEGFNLEWPDQEWIDKRDALNARATVVLQEDRSLGEDTVSLPQERIAQVIDVHHPLYGMHCKIGIRREDGLYPLTVVDDPWHGGYAYAEQLGQREEKPK